MFTSEQAAAVEKVLLDHRPANWSSLFCNSYETCKWTIRGKIRSVREEREAMAAHQRQMIEKALEEI